MSWPARTQAKTQIALGSFPQKNTTFVGLMQPARPPRCAWRDCPCNAWCAASLCWADKAPAPARDQDSVMPLSPPAPRHHLHTRRIEINGFLRDDGDIDVEAHLTDTRSYAHARRDGSVRHPSEPLHDMWLRMTITAQREIVACDASMDATPFAICPKAAPNFARLAGLRIEGGFLKRAMDRVGGSEGCTHLRELLQQIGTVFVQTLYSVGKISDDRQEDGTARPPLLNTCYAWGESHDMVAERFPAWHRQAAPQNA
jgi:hypothetical protein